MSKTSKYEQYDVSHKLKKLFDIKTEQRNVAKEYYQKLLYNPFRPVNDGIPFDPALQRYNAMSMYHVEYFKPTPKTMSTYFLMICPFFLLYFHFQYVKRKQEEVLRSGVISYADRKYKLYF